MFGFGVWGSCDRWSFRASGRRLTFFLLRQRSKGKEERRPWSTGLRQVPLRPTRFGRGQSTSSRMAHRPGRNSSRCALLKHPRPLSAQTCVCSASPQGPGKRHGMTSGSLFQTLFRVSNLGVRRFPRPVDSAEQRGLRGKGEDRLRPMGRVPQRPREDRVAQRTLRRALTPGRLFFCVLSFWRSKKCGTPGAKPPSHEERKPKIPWSCPRFHPGFTQNPAIESADQPGPGAIPLVLMPPLRRQLLPHPPRPQAAGRQSPESTLPKSIIPDDVIRFVPLAMYCTN